MTQATFKTAVVLAMKSEPETPLALAEDLRLLADSPQLLVMALRKSRTETDQLRSPKNLQGKVVPQLKKAFLESIDRAAEGQLPPEVGRLLQRKKPLLFLIGDIVSGNAEGGERAQGSPARPATSGSNFSPPDNEKTTAASDRSEPAQTATTAAAFADAFDQAFHRLEKQGRSHNVVSLVDLRRAVPFDKQAFNAGLHELRRAGRYSLSAADGGRRIGPEEQDAGITEDGALLLYVSRKLS